MATPPLSFLEKKWQLGSQSGRTDRLVRGSRQQIDRQYQQLVDTDTHQNVSSYGRQLLATLGRLLFWNSSAVRAAVLEQAELAVPFFIPQFEGEDQAWGEMAENWMFEHDKICHTRGWPYDMSALMQNMVVGELVSGDEGVAFVQNEEGYPFFTPIAAHRIGSMDDRDMVVGGPYDGATQIDGVIVTPQLAPLAYRVRAGRDGNGMTDVAARDMLLHFDPKVSDLVRGVSPIGAAAFDWDDLKDARRFELVAQKIGAAIALIEQNETGEADESKAMLTSKGDVDSDLKVTRTAREVIDGVQVRYFKAGSNSKLESFSMDRPTPNQQAFRDDVLREALNGIGWSFDFSHNPTRAGGAQMRVVIDKINRRLDRTRALIEKARRRMDGWRLSCAIKLGLLPENPDWFRWSYQGPGKLTADAKYDSDVDIQERRSGIGTLAKSTAKRGDYWRDVRNQRDVEAADLLTRAQKLADQFKISIELALSLLEKPDANPIQSAADSAAPAAGTAPTAP